MLPASPEFVEALNRMMRTDLEYWSELWFWLLVGATAAVVIGLLCEAPEVWHAIGLGHETVSRVRRFWYIRVRKIDLSGWDVLCPELVDKNDRVPKWIARVGFIGWALVAFGVAGEGLAEYFVNDAETALRIFDKAILTETQHSANSAAEASSLANAFSNKAVDSSKYALSIAKGARQEADSFEKDIASAKEQATESAVELAKLKAPRVIKPEDQQAVCNELTTFAGTKFDMYVATSQEAIDLMGSIKAILICAKWVQVDAKQIIGLSDSNPRVGLTTVSGVKIEIADSRTQDWDSIIRITAPLLRAVGIDAHAGRVLTGLDSEAIHVSVGNKPQ
jgi:hypothetical protein